jgi:hypothetical protein
LETKLEIIPDSEAGNPGADIERKHGIPPTKKENHVGHKKTLQN